MLREDIRAQMILIQALVSFGSRTIEYQRWKKAAVKSYSDKREAACTCSLLTWPEVIVSFSISSASSRDFRGEVGF